MKNTVIIGGGAAGMACAVHLGRAGYPVALLERGGRLGRKLSATGNGQGNITNQHMNADCYFSDDCEKVSDALSRFGERDTVAFLQSMGGIFLPDGRGRVYPASRQASAVTDLFRRELSRLGIRICTDAQVLGVTYDGNFRIRWAGGDMRADAVVLATGGKAAPNFGTDGSAYSLAQSFGHSITPLSPVLVQLKCDRENVRGLKGIRVDALLRARRAQKEIARERGDLLFTDSGISGDAVFRISSYAKEGDLIEVDLLPDISEEELFRIISASSGEDCLLCVVNNGLGRTLYRRAEGNISRLAALLKRFPLTVRGTLGFEYAQATRGGIPLAETDKNFMSKKRDGLYFAGEILNVDGICGGYNLQWAFTSAYCVAEAIK